MAFDAARPDSASDPFSTVSLLYLAGMGRSGSTLVERVLGELPGVCSLGEVVFLWQRGIVANELCGCGTPFLECPFWSKIGNLAFGGWDRVDTERITYLRHTVDDLNHLPRLIGSRDERFRRELAEYVGYYTAIYRAAQQCGGERLVVDSSKLTSLAYCLRRSPELTLRILHMVRDSHGVAYSWTKKISRPESPAGGERPYMPTFTPARSAVLWAGHNAVIELARLLGTPVKLLRYEDFVTAPPAALARILGFAGLPAPPDLPATIGPDWVRLGSTHQVAGNPMRFQTGRIAIRSDDQWRSALAPRQRRTVTAITTPVSLMLGYRPTGRPAPAQRTAGRGTTDV
jgi:hypothetical protein